MSISYMRAKIILNTLYTIGIALCIIGGYKYGIVHREYLLLVAAVVFIVILVYLKIEIIKDVKNNTKKP